jgi:hypothetical protein
MSGEESRGESMRRLIGIGIAALFLAVSIVPASEGAGAGATKVVSEDVQATAKWSVLVYLLADNDLDPYTAEDFQELKDGGSSEDVNVLMLVDRLNEPAYLYCIQDNDMVMLESYGEINMGDPETLKGFVEYSDLNYPAEHMLLFFWDHGTPTGGVGVDTTLPGSEPGTDWDWLSHHEMISALEGHHLDIIATDECSIGQMETVYEYYSKGLSLDYLVASESYIGWRGFSYDKIVQRMISEPEIGARELSLVIVEEFTELFSNPPYMSEILTTQSVFDMAKIPALGDAVTAMAKVLASDIDDYRSIIYEAQAVSMMPWGARCEGWTDMPIFVEQIMGAVKKGDPAYGACQAVLEAYSEAMIGMGITKNSDMYGYEGMGILFPPSYSMYTIGYYDTVWGGFKIYSTFDFPNMGWLEFLQAYWGVVD